MLRERTSGIPGAVDKRESRKDGMGTNVIGLGQRKGISSVQCNSSISNIWTKLKTIVYIVTSWNTFDTFDTL